MCFKRSSYCERTKDGFLFEESATFEPGNNQRRDKRMQDERNIMNHAATPITPLPHFPGILK
jgi:hypothetical protein